MPADSEPAEPTDTAETRAVSKACSVPEPIIGTLNEGSLHVALKDWYARPGDRFEVPLHGFVIDIMRKSLLIEIQTSGFGAMGKKMDRLLEEHHMLLVHPVAVRTWLNRPDAKPKRSPKRGSIYSIFDELVSVPTLLDNPNLTLDIVLVEVDKHQVMDPKAKRGRGGFRTIDRSLRSVEKRVRFSSVDDLCELIPDGLPEEFTTADLASAGGFSRDVAQKMAYCFRPLEVFEELRRTRAGYVYRRIG